MHVHNAHIVYKNDTNVNTTWHFNVIEPIKTFLLYCIYLLEFIHEELCCISFSKKKKKLCCIFFFPVIPNLT